VEHNTFKVVEQKPSVIVSYGDRIISSAINEHVSRVVQINVIFLHIGEIEEEGSIYKHNREINYFKRRYYIYCFGGFNYKIITKFDAIFAGCGRIDCNIRDFFLQGLYLPFANNKYANRARIWHNPFKNIGVISEKKFIYYIRINGNGIQIGIR
jgi:hypothetical protein